MNIKNSLRKALLEGKHKNTTHKNEYGCLMVYLEVEEDTWGKLLEMIDDKDLYEPEGDSGYGKETEPHVTILFGFHADIPDSDIEVEIDKIKTPKIEIEGISSFKNELFDVLKFDVESDDMHALNKKFKKFPNTTKYPDYHPHGTIAYLKPGLSEKYIKKMKDFAGITIKPSHLIYSKSDGTKKTYNLN